MPALAALISTLFLGIAEFLTARLSFGIAIGLAVAATFGIAVVAMKAALSAVWAGASLVLPASVVTGLGWIDPGNFGSTFGSIILIDVIRSSFDYWYMSAGMAMGARNL